VSAAEWFPPTLEKGQNPRMIHKNLSQKRAGFAAIFIGANYPSLASKNLICLGVICHVVPQVLRSTLRCAA
jgi:hypothetical protein